MIQLQIKYDSLSRMDNRQLADTMAAIALLEQADTNEQSDAKQATPAAAAPAAVATATAAAADSKS